MKKEVVGVVEVWRGAGRGPGEDQPWRGQAVG